MIIKSSVNGNKAMDLNRVKKVVANDKTSVASGYGFTVAHAIEFMPSGDIWFFSSQALRDKKLKELNERLSK